MKITLLLLVLFPFLGSLFLAVFGRRVPRRAVETVACGSVLASLVMAVAALAMADQKSYCLSLFNWFGVADFSAAMSVLYDPLAAVMALMVTFVSSLIHLYSVSFMRDDKDYVRYFCFLNLFVAAMLVITVADNLVFLYLGWEGVGFCSYALIGFWYGDVLKAAAGRKAFVLTRIGDVAFGIAIALVFVLFNTVSISSINSESAGLGVTTATAIGLLLLWAAVGKSAQLPLVVWLPDAMAGPTPVSALIHAATMVTAGVYLLMKLFPIISLSPVTLLVIAVVGTVSALYAACAALAQRDIKRVLAYSTISQVGYMFLAVGAGDIVGSMFHLLSHAFFKALLFMAAGCIIQALHEEHDIFKMGNLRDRMPEVFWLFLAGALALGALPLTGGFFSKDRILLATFSHPGAVYHWLWGAALVTAFLTALYTFRLFFLACLGRPGVEGGREILPIPRFMVWIMWPLAILALGAGVINLPAIWRGGEWLSRFLMPVVATVPGSVRYAGNSPGLEWSMEGTSGLIALAGIVLAYILYAPTTLLRITKPFTVRKGLYELFASGFYLDRLYEIGISRPYRRLAAFSWLSVDEGTLDEGLDGTAKLFATFSVAVRLWTTGRLSAYLKMLFLGFAAILGILVLGWYFS